MRPCVTNILNQLAVLSGKSIDLVMIMLGMVAHW